VHDRLSFQKYLVLEGSHAVTGLHVKLIPVVPTVVGTLAVLVSTNSGPVRARCRLIDSFFHSPGVTRIFLQGTVYFIRLNVAFGQCREARCARPPPMTNVHENYVRRRLAVLSRYRRAQFVFISVLFFILFLLPHTGTQICRQTVARHGCSKKLKWHARAPWQ
jgi:hypothetical protein